MELSLGVSLRVLRFLLGSDWSPLSIHFPHDRLTPLADYVVYFGCTPHFAERTAGFTIRMQIFVVPCAVMTSRTGPLSSTSTPSPHPKPDSGSPFA